MSTPQVEIADVPPEGRGKLEFILEESFEGLYLRHSKRTLAEIETVRGAFEEGAPAGLIMVKALDEKTGYIYYVAVAKAKRGQGIASKLLEDALGRFREAAVEDAFASVEEDNAPSWRLFSAHGFTRTTIGEVARTYGMLNAINMYRVMRVVPGEALLHKKLV